MIVLIQIKPCNYTTYYKRKGKQKRQTCLTRHYDFEFTNLFKNVTEVALSTLFAEVVKNYGPNLIKLLGAYLGT